MCSWIGNPISDFPKESHPNINSSTKYHPIKSDMTCRVLWNSMGTLNPPVPCSSPFSKAVAAGLLSTWLGGSVGSLAAELFPTVGASVGCS